MRMLSPLSNGYSWPRGDVFEDFDRIVDGFLRPAIANAMGPQASYEVNETNDNYLISFDMPGVKKQDIKIEVQGNQLMISGERHGDSTRKFERSFVLPASINTEKIEAQYEDGVLSVALPKAEAAKSRTIEIQSGQGGFLSRLVGSKKDSAKELKEVKFS